MNFFEHQDRARRSTTRLVVLFTLAVIAIVGALNLAAFFLTRVIAMHDIFRRDAAPVFRGDREYPGRLQQTREIWREPPTYVWVTLGTLATIAAGSLYKLAQLSGGGAAVAQMLGGTPLVPNTSSPADRQLQNIVEEMSIASGVPVPQIFVMRDEPGINAFAAGFTTQDAVISVTQGCVEQLSRDELQGVVAHEFSHILNGDMRINLRLIGILNGILLIALLGYFLLRSTAYSRPRQNDRGGGNGVILMMLAGAALVVIGYVGVFFGRLIQAAVSRQREFLADASAVQFTRNPSGLVGALKKIGAASSGSKVNNAQALGTAHLFFASAFRGGFTQLLATHPPLAQRIKALDPAFDGTFPIGGAATEILDAARTGERGALLASMLASTASRPGMKMNSRQAVERVGTVSPPQIRYAAELVAAIPDVLRTAARDPFSARALVLALLTDEEPELRQKQYSLLRMSTDPPTLREYQRMLDAVDAFRQRARLSLLNLSLPALRQLSPAQASDFLSIIKGLIEADRRVTLFEFSLYRLVQKQLRPEEERSREPIQYFSVSAVRDDAAALISALASASSTETERAFEAGAEALDVSPPIQMARLDGLKSLDRSLGRLSRSSPPVKRRVIAAAAATVSADGEINVAEAELLRAASATLGVPMPLFLPDASAGQIVAR